MDVARTWGCHWLEHVLSPKSHLPIPKFPPSAYLSSPLASVLTLARYLPISAVSSVVVTVRIVTSSGKATSF